MEFINEVALVTGSSRGIGKGIAYALAEQGAVVIINGTKKENVERTVLEFTNQGKKAVGCVFDASDNAMVNSEIDRVTKEVGNITILVNNAGISPKKNNKKVLIKDMDYEEWVSAVNVNINGVFSCSRAVIPSMIENRKGKIINISSAFARYYTPLASASHYITTKTAVLGFTRALSSEVAQYGINCNAIAPGRAWTDMTRVQPEEINNAFMETIPMGRFAEIEDIANTVVFLASEKSSYINGATIDINGGVCMV